MVLAVSYKIGNSQPFCSFLYPFKLTALSYSEGGGGTDRRTKRNSNVRHGSSYKSLERRGMRRARGNMDGGVGFPSTGTPKGTGVVVLTFHDRIGGSYKKMNVAVKGKSCRIRLVIRQSTDRETPVTAGRHIRGIEDN